MTPSWTRLDRLASLCVLATFAVLGASIADALRIAPLPEHGGAAGSAAAAPATPEMDDDDAAAADAAGPADPESAGHAVLAAVARDPFRPDRRRAPDRYRLPGEAFAMERAAQRAPIPALRLVGTASYGDGGGFAALALQGRAPRLVPVGDTLAGLMLVSVDTGSATLEGADTVVLLELVRRPAGRGRR